MPPSLPHSTAPQRARVHIVAEDLVIARGGRTVIDGLSFSVAPGEALILKGPNGAGKTTVLRTLAGYLKPASGQITLGGGDGELTLAEQAHMIGHSNALKTQLSVAENLMFWAGYLNDAAAAGPPVKRALQHFGLADLAEFPVAYLSAGQRRRAGLARLLAVYRPVWLLDEPTVSLDAASTERLADAVNAHTSEGGLVIAATHLPLGFARVRELTIGSQESTP
jgi:heme exporter protein A